MSVAAGGKILRGVLGFGLFGLIALSNSAPGAAQAPPASPQRWDGLIERLSAPGQWEAESFTNPRVSRHAVSADGRYFVFMAEVQSPPHDPWKEFFVRDRMTGDTTRTGPGPLNAAPVISSDGAHRAAELCDPMYRYDGLRICDVWAIDGRTSRYENMSTATDGTPSLGDSSEPMLSATGRFIVFRTNSPTLLPPNSAPGQIVLRDRDADQDGILDEPGASSLRVVSVSSAGETGNLESAAAEVSADGRFVAFRSRASNLVPGDTNGAWDVFLHDVQTGETRRINVGWDGREATPTIDSPAISMSEDGAFVAFAADNWFITDPTRGSDDNNNALDVFVFDRVAGTLSRIDIGADGALGNGHTHWPSLSADGRYVSVVSNATNVANPGTPGRAHVFVYDRTMSQATRVSVNPDGTEPDRDSAYSTISGDGSVVTFISQATNLPTGAPPNSDTIYAAVHFDVTPLTLTLPARGGELTATVTAQRYVTWEAQLADWSWLNWGSTGAYGMGDGTATFRAYRNYDGTARTTSVTVRSKTITVTQEPGLNIAGFAPAQGPATGGTLVSISGTGFEPDMQVYFDGVNALAVEFVDTTLIRAVTPPHAAGDAWIYVATADWEGAAMPWDAFRYQDVTPPEIYPWTGGTQTPDGWFTSDVQISFGYWDADSTIISADGCNPPPLTTDTAGTTYTCSVTSEGGTSTASIAVKRDATGPAIDVVNPAQTIYRSGAPAPIANYTCSDALTGVTECSGMLPLGQPVEMTPGHHDFWVTARDTLGNWSARTITYAVTEGGCSPRPEGLVAWFPFETTSGAPQPTYAEPVNGSDATPVNTQFVAGAVGSFAVAPADSAAYVTTGPSGLFDMTAAFSLAAWVKPGASTGAFEVIAGHEGEYLLGISPDGTLHWSLSTPTRAWGWNRTSLQLQRNVWAHVALVYDGSQVTVYLNGMTREGWSTAGEVVDIAPEFNEFRIGARENASSPSYFSGAIDDVLLANRAFSSEELQRIAFAANDGLCGPRPTTVTVAPDPFTATYAALLSRVYTLSLTSEGSPVRGRTLLFFDPYGYFLGSAQTDANGEIRFGAPVVPTSVGTQPGFQARFLGDFHYSSSVDSNVMIVERAAPVITWPAPASIPYGTPLGAQQLNASANVAGTFTYTPATGTQLGIGSHTLTVQFDPADATNYRSATATTTLSVVDPTPPVIVPFAEGTLGGNGWYTSDVRISFSVQDPESGIVNSTNCAPVILATDTTGVTYTCTATSAGGTASASVVVKRDTAAPEINLVVPAATLYEPTLSWRSNYSCTDPLSGAATCEGPVPNGTALDLTTGYHAFTVVATDRAGNRSTKDVTYAVASRQCAARPAGFVAWWPFEQPYGSSGATASYRDMFSGIVDTGVNTDWRFGPGPVGFYAMSTAASSSAYMSAGTRPQLQLTQALTVATWVYPYSTFELGVIAGREGEYLLARFPDGTLRYSLATATPGWGWINTGHVLERVWSHVALTYDGAVVRAYVNGREVHAAPASGPIGDVAPQLNEFRVGARQDPSGLAHFTGGIDDLHVYSRAIDPAEIEQVFLAGIKGLCAPGSTYIDVLPNPVGVTFGTTRGVEIVARLSTSSTGGAPLPGRPVTIFKSDSPIASGMTDANGEFRVTTAVTGLIPGTNWTAFRVQHTGDFYYASQSVYVPLVTEKATPQITWASQTMVYGAPLGPDQLNATANVGGTFVYVPAAGTVLPVGMHTLSATFTPWYPQNYTEATATVTLEVTKASPRVVVETSPATYDGLPHGATGTVTGVDGAILGPLTFTYDGGSDAPVNAGTYEVVASFAGDANHTAATATETLRIAKAAATVTAIGGSYTYDGAEHHATGTVTGADGAPLGPLTFTYNGASEAPVDAGTYEVVASFAGDANHEAASGTATLTIANGTATVIALGGSYTYDGAAHPATGTVTGVGGATLGPLTFTYNGASEAPVNAGTYEVVASFAGDANHAAASATATITIAKGIATVTASGGSFTYDGAAHPATGTVTGVGGATIGSLTFTYNGSSEVPVNAGTYDVVASFAGDANHGAASATATLTIAKAAAIVSAVGGSYTYDGAAHPATGAATGVGGATLGPLTFTYNGAVEAPVNAGTYDVVASFAGDANHAAASATATLTIEKAAVIVSAVGGSYTYDGAAHPATGAATGVGGATLGPLTFTYNGAVEAPVNAGTYDVVASFAGDANHAAASASAAIIIGRAAAIVQWAAPGAITYGTPLGAAQLNATANTTGAFAYSLASGTVLSAGSHSLSVTFTPADATNYTGASTSTTVTVTPAPLTVRAVDAVKRFGAPLPVFTAAMTGFVNGDSAASLAGTLSLATSGTQHSSVGVYPIVPSGVSSPNYSIGFISGTLTIIRGTVDVTVATSPEPSGVDAPMTFTASVAAAAASGNPTGSVRFFDGATLIGSAPLNAGVATLSTAGLDPGVRTIEARYDGDASFEPGAGSASHVIRDASQTPSIALSSSRNPSNAGQTVTLTATVNMPSGPVTGLVEFRSGETLLGTSPIAAGRAAFTTSALAAGSHAITARYTGAGDVPPSRSEVFIQAVGATGWKNRATSMAIVGNPNPAALGDTLDVTADVTGTSGVAPTGRIVFMVDGMVVASVTATPLSGTAARATLSLPGLAHGRHGISATYLGDQTYKGSTARITVPVN